MIFKTQLIVMAASLAIVVTQGSPAYATPPMRDDIIHCNMGGTALTVYESETPGIFEQKLFLRGQGAYALSVSTSDFTFQGYAYARRAGNQNWTLIKRTRRGIRVWPSHWRIRSYEYGSDIRLQIIPEEAPCKGCTVSIRVKAECA